MCMGNVQRVFFYIEGLMYYQQFLLALTIKTVACSLFPVCSFSQASSGQDRSRLLQRHQVPNGPTDHAGCELMFVGAASSIFLIGWVAVQYAVILDGYPSNE